MRSPLWIVAPLALVAVGLARSPAPEPGALVVVGGGGTPDDVVARALALAGGEDASVVVLPHASAREDRGASSAEMFRAAGARDVAVLDDQAPGAIAALVADADLIWFPGGSQNRLMDALGELELVDDVQAAHARGAVVGGTSAGAAVQSARMITGEARLDALLPGTTELADGLGLWRGVLVDQHFVARQRNNRLLSAVIDSGLIGVGIDERTAVVVHPDGEWEVMGESVALVYDPREAILTRAQDDTWDSAFGVGLHVLRTETTFTPCEED